MILWYNKSAARSSLTIARHGSTEIVLHWGQPIRLAGVALSRNSGRSAAPGESTAESDKGLFPTITQFLQNLDS